MAILGKLIQSSIKVADQILPDGQSPAQDQLLTIKSIMKKAENTSFGLYHGFSNMLESEDPIKKFQQEVPITDYHAMEENWWKKQQLYPNITWPGKPNFFALSSGTTGKSSKRIPVTDDTVFNTKKVGLDFLRAVSQMPFDESLFESEILMLSSSASLSKNERGFHEGEISGINVQSFPGWYEVFYRPGKEIAAIPEWEDRLERMVAEAPEWNVGSIAGIPSWILMLLRAIIDEYKLDTIHDIWPNLQLFASGGVAYDTYRESFDAITERPLHVLDTYLASEGFFAYGTDIDKMDMTLATNHGVFYEFLPFNEEAFDETGNILEEPKVLRLDEIETDMDYAMLITTASGLYRYMIGDTIKFTSTQPAKILITGRTKFFLNVVGSQLSEEKMNTGVVELAKKFDVEITEFMVSAMKIEDDFIHQWIIVSDQKIDEESAMKELDKNLREANKNYGVARDKALKGVRMKVITPDAYNKLMKEFSSTGGQTKIPKVVKRDKMNDYLKFLETRSF